MTTTTPLGSAPRHDSALAGAVARFCREGHEPPPTGLRQGLPSSDRWRSLAAAGTALWLDSGDVEAVRKLWTREFTALTTNNTLLNKEVQKGIYDQLIPRAADLLRKCDPKVSPERLVLEIAFILNAVHGLRLVRTFDADVSVELHTDLARDTEASYQYGKRFHAIDPDRFIVKIPLTPEGIVAARRLGREKIEVNFTLGFSARQNQLIALVARPAFVNVFMGRLNSFIQDRKLGDGRNVGEKATLASQRALRALNTRRGSRVRQIGASIRSGQQCHDLTGLDVFTIPTAAAEDYLKLALSPGAVRDRTAEDPPVALNAGLDLATEKLDDLWDVGGPLPGALAALEREDLDALAGSDLVAFLSKHGVGDLFPKLTAAEAADLAQDGKIPQHTRWKERVQAGTASWDGIFTEAALASFAADQRQLDERIRKFV